MALTPRQREVYDFVARFIEQRGFAPTMAEIGEQFGLRSPATVHQLLSALESEGLIRRVPHASRAIELVEQSTPELSGEIPLLGTVAAGRDGVPNRVGPTVQPDTRPGRCRIPAGPQVG